MKFLRSKGIVAILALVAVGLVLKNIMLPIFYSGRPPSRVERIEEENLQKVGGISQIKEEIIQQVETMTGESLLVADLEKIGWAIEYARDPFSSQTLQAEAETTAPVEAGKTPDASAEVVEPLDCTLVGVVQESGKILAVINDVIVGVGDYYEDYEVIKIDLDSVELKGPDGYIEHIEMEF